MNLTNNLTFPLVSVVVPVYNMEKYLKRCVDSILEQTYENLEIILVDDCSSDKSAEIIENYKKADDRVKSIRHEKNSGLFQARITGSEIATGKYIAFVDSDDYISVDWFRKFVRKAEETESDIVVGEWCFDTDGKHKDYCNMDHFRLEDYCLEGKDIMDTFMEVRGRNFSWTVVWNKLYSKKLWDKVYPLVAEHSTSHGHMIMWEDIAFSSALWSYAEKVTNVHGTNYFYFKHEGASTHTVNNKKRNLKYINDASSAINFFKKVLISKGIFEEYEDRYNLWKKNAIAIIYKDLVINLNKKTYKDSISEAFQCNEEDYKEPQEFFYSITTPLQDSFELQENIKKKIVSEKIKYVSFDIFDTLINRPFLYPSDLFSLLSEKFNEEISSYVNFKAIRQQAENTVRKMLEQNRPSREEITFDEIYDYIKKNYNFDEKLIDKIKKYEIELELKFCNLRKKGKELFDLAIESGKKVIICSDMYLTKDVIIQILKKNCIEGYEKLYVSSEIGLTKEQKSLYKYVQKDLNCKDTSSFIHIGDNYHSDIENSSACGWNKAHISKASDIILNYNPDIYGGEVFNKLYLNSFFKEDYRNSFNDFTSVRSILAMSANKFFDNPYVSVNPWSDFNADPRMIGYSALGPHLLALCMWIYKIVKREKIGTIHFVARDGFLVKQAFDLFNFTGVKTNYIRVSRKALVLADVESVEDIYSLYNKVTPKCPPKELAEYLNPIIPTNKKSDVEKIFEDHGFKYDRKLKNLVEYEKCLKIFIEEIIDLDMLPTYKEKLKNYFSEIVSPGDYIFDIGYSGRPESSLSSVLGFTVGSLYIHLNGEIAGIRQEKYNCPSESFYQFKPSITGVMREHLLMELGPSTVGYEEIDGKLTPKFEEYNAEYCSEYVTHITQGSALQFIKDYNDYFRDFKLMYNFQNEVISAPYEYYLHYSKSIDRQIFSTLPFEDDLGEGKTMSALDFWNNEISTRNLNVGYAGSSGPSILPDLYMDGYFVKFYYLMNKMFPKGGRAREFMKKIAGIFMK